MKEKIFAELKQAYSSLGLGDEVLQAHAESLANLGLVTDTNLEAVVKAQKVFLEGLQKNMDKRATDAQRKAEEKAKADREREIKEAEEKAQKEKEEAEKAAAEAKAKKEAEDKAAAEKAKAEEKARQEGLSQEWLDRFNKQQELIESLTKSVNEKYSSFESDILAKYNALKEESDAAKAEKAQKQRQAFILDTAKKLGIPQYRIDEGFSITDNDDEAKIEEFLTKVSNNIKTNNIPRDSRESLGEDKPSKEEIDKIASMIVK